jgi:hypothetical protein
VTALTSAEVLMPPLPSVATVLRLTIEGDTPTHAWANVLHWNYTGGVPSSVNCKNFADQLFGAWGTNFGPFMLTGSHVLRATCVDLSSPTGGSGEQIGSMAGTAGAVEIPGSAAVLVKKVIGRRYRGGHPRTYVFAGIQTDLADPSHWGNTLLTGVFGAYEAVRVAMDGHTDGATTLGVEVVVSYVDKATNPVAPYHRAVPLVFPVASFSVESAIGTQRRRIGR